VIEEAPSPFLDDATRKAMGEQAVALAKAVNYQSAGTVEFVVGKDKSFYFLEMNTRLQVEHPVTECITGLDLVEQMIRVAAGEKLAFTQDQIPRKGWAMECRINAEDPLRNFLPSTGRLVKYQPPSARDGVRVDTGVFEGGEIPMYYDSMIAKLITHGANRDEAMSKMRGALNQFVIRGIHSNIQFQSALLQHPRFISGKFNTGFIAEEFPKGFTNSSVQASDPNRLPALACFVHRRYLERAKLLEGQLLGHEMKITQEFVVVHDQQSYNTRIEQKDHGYQITVKPNQGSGQISEYFLESDWQPGSIRLQYRLNHQAEQCVQVERPGLGYIFMQDGLRFECVVLSPFGAELQRRMPYKAPPDTSKLLLSPMPGLLTKLHVAKGDKVSAGQKLVVIEAMKMENTLSASQDGIVEEICASEGSSLAVDQIIIKFAK
jgi:propionyl-CoA carboxylase alpha chain